MSTRCQARIVKNGYPLNLYCHCDGYLEGVGRRLKAALEATDYEPCDFTEFIVHGQTEDHFEPTFSNHGDIEFFYLLDFDNEKFTAYEIEYPDNGVIWPQEGDDDYDQYKPNYNQIPRHYAVVDLTSDTI